MSSNPDDIAPVENAVLQNLLQGGRRSLARAITSIENEFDSSKAILDAILNQLGQAHVVGFTGPPGVGKSTLIDACIPVIRQQNESVAILAIDPSSVVSGGALLGDRIRMESHSEDDKVFIRSVATRGQLGGLTPTTLNIINLFDAAGWDKILVETVGTGQSDVEISRIADTTVVVDAPGLGDDIQTIKAGLLEVADILVVNKSDLPNADQRVSDFKQSFALRQGATKPQVLKTLASTAEGVPELMSLINSHGKSLKTKRQQNSIRKRTKNYVARALGNTIEAEFLRSQSGWTEEICKRVQSGETDIETLGQEILEGILQAQSRQKSM